MKLRICLVAWLSATSPVDAQVSTVADAMHLCTEAGHRLTRPVTPQEAHDIGFCAGVAAGVAWVMMSNCNVYRIAPNTYSAGSGLRAAPPITLGAALQAFRNWARENPQFWNEPMPEGAVRGLNKGIPCE
jgi:hypothetical protein